MELVTNCVEIHNYAVSLTINILLHYSV